MWEELENALATIKAPPNRWIQSGKKDLQAAAQWIWEVIMGDFNENEQSTAQIVTGTIISMVPYIDQICDVRDLVANCKKINEDPSSEFLWIALILTLIGLFPGLGSLAKGGLKVLFAYGRRGVLKAGAKAINTKLGEFARPSIEEGIRKFNQFLARKEVQEVLKRLKIVNPYQWFANKTRKLEKDINEGVLLDAFDKLWAAGIELLLLVSKYGDPRLQQKVSNLIQMVTNVRNKAKDKFHEVKFSVKDWLNCLARRLEIEGDNYYRAILRWKNTHSINSPEAEAAAFDKAKPNWVDKVKFKKNKPLDEFTPVEGYPDIGDSAAPPLKKAYKTFNTLKPTTYPPGTVSYRIVDPGAAYNSIYWMTKAEFDKLKSKDDWRRKFAVWVNWNKNGEYVTYTVPPGKPLKAWEGKTATQEIKGTDYKLEGGAEQIVLDPKDLEMGYLGKRKPTNWGYKDLGEKLDIVGAPVLKNHWRE